MDRDLSEWEEKAAFLGEASATLFPITAEEAFGLVLIESLATGTPVVAFGRAAVDELVRDRRTGFIVDDVDAIAAALARIQEIERRECRRDAEERFSVERLVGAYEDAYRTALRERREPPTIASVPSSNRTHAFPLPS